MQFNKQIIALVGLLATSTVASDVYSTFYDSQGNEVASVSFDVSNEGCFSIPNAVDVAFSQGGVSFTNAGGPYCLYAFPQGGCGGNANTQSFSDVNISGNVKLSLNSGVANQPSYHWTPRGC